MNLIDLHCDTASWLHYQGEKTNLRNNDLCVDLEKMRKAGSMAQFFACFINMQFYEGEDRFTQAYEYARSMVARIKQEFDKNNDLIRLARNWDELKENHEIGKMSGFLTVEEGGIIDGKMERLEALYQEGIRLITLTWNFENCIGFPNSSNPNEMNRGLKKFGIEVIERMNELGMLVDVSHLSDGGFWDVLKYSKKPVIASHSNARNECPHQRNLSDEMIHGLADRGGVAGINFYPLFLNGSDKAGVDDIVHHIVHMYHVGGEELVAIGTDFDGFSGSKLDISDTGKMPQLYEALRKRKFTERQLELLWSKNAQRVIQEVIS